jgi:hypothetical protein
MFLADRSFQPVGVIPSLEFRGSDQPQFPSFRTFPAIGSCHETRYAGSHLLSTWACRRFWSRIDRLRLSGVIWFDNHFPYTGGIACETLRFANLSRATTGPLVTVTTVAMSFRLITSFRCRDNSLAPFCPLGVISSLRLRRRPSCLDAHRRFSARCPMPYR